MSLNPKIPLTRMVVVVSTLLLVPAVASADKLSPKTESGMACSQECSQKHGKPAGKDPKYKSGAYEGCMMQCTAERKKQTAEKTGAPKK